MKKNKKVGAACGRIHPIGSGKIDFSFLYFRIIIGSNRGPVVWYQKFEYAIGHWLQKAAEHILRLCRTLIENTPFISITNKS